MEIGKQIKKYRMEMGFSQEELSEKVFVSRQTISNWENNKNYPDIKSLLLLSSIFSVSLDILVKGDLEEMKEKIKAEDINGEDISRFKHDSNIFAILLLLTIILPIPLMKFMGKVGLIICVVVAVIAIYYSIRVEKYKKSFDIQTYREILTFIEGKNMDDIEKNQEYGKRPYQKFLLAIGTGLVAIIVAIIMSCILL
ncbi:TPA: helix-turn-helix transcriptional regulator [Clostridioides difficile]|uniref:helix-turn-helix domain-containing protein n=1 Tax=Clostridium tertium TaxID=1559 RepID=UPI002028B4C4|nr:helix-turn-helix transcriptional regulator [Clostridium tertium]HDO9489881.1 helix-turn-helix transcriptional regulator [Clostridioides difficile]